MDDPISVAVSRGGTVESVHLAHAVAVDRTGEVIAAAGDPELVTFMRSAAKPLQALPLARAYEDLTDEEIAIASASHLANENSCARSARSWPEPAPPRTTSSADPTGIPRRG